jgi:hypothetical protein
MEKLNYNQLLEKVKQYCENKVEDFAWLSSREHEGLGNVVAVDSTGGEDRGSDWSRVLHFTDHDIYIKISGYYSSDHGTDFEDWQDAVKEVRPKQQTITVYEA